MSSIATVLSGVLAAEVAAAGTFAVTIPTGLTAGHFAGAVNHSLVLAQSNLIRTSQFSISFSGSTATITNATSAAWPAGSAWTLELDMVGTKDYIDPRTGFSPNNTAALTPLVITLGSPALGVANAITTSATITAPAAAVLTTSPYVMDAPRNVVAAWTNTATITVVGTDEYGTVISETSGSGTSFTGKKAFKTVTSVTPSVTIAAATVGTGGVLGLPVCLPFIGAVTRELEDGISATAGTLVKADQTKATATTGDVRGTYVPNSALNGAKSFQLFVELPDAGYRGVTQA